jgi:polynucleotide 5'-hydroxyl-kinase GRC3/NOL9
MIFDPREYHGHYFLMTDERDISHLIDLVAGSRIAIVIGNTDTGKSTLIKRIAERIDVSIVDADIGQSDIGPPTVVSLGEDRNGRYHMIDGYFCGSTTPSGHFLQLMAGMARMAGQAKRSPVLINTIGLATGDIGRSLNTEVINALKPDLIIGISEGDELAYLDVFQRTGAQIVHLPVSPYVKKKTASERTQNRQLAFAEHFQNASSKTLSFGQFAVERSLLFNGTKKDIYGDIHDILYVEVSGSEAVAVSESRIMDIDDFILELGVGTLYVYTIDAFAGALVGLMDSDGRFLGLGIIESIDFKNEQIRIYTTVTGFSVMQFGSIKLKLPDFAYGGPFHPKIFRA